MGALPQGLRSARVGRDDDGATGAHASCACRRLVHAFPPVL